MFGPLVAAITVLLLTLVALIYSICSAAANADRQWERMQEDARRRHPSTD